MAKAKVVYPKPRLPAVPGGGPKAMDTMPRMKAGSKMTPSSKAPKGGKGKGC